MKAFLTILFFTALIACSFATEEDVLRTIKKIENNKLGKTLLDTIQLQLQAGDPVEDLIHLLQRTEEELEKAQDDDDKFIEVLQHECDDELARLDDEIASTKKRIEELEAELAEKIPIRDEKVRVLADKKEFKALLEEKIVELDHNKELKDQEWAEEQEQHDQAQYVIEKAKQIIVDSLKAGFLQKSQTTAFAQVSEHFNKHSKSTSFKRKSWNAIFKLLSQITASAPIQSDQSSVQTIIDLCDQILDKIAESREIERKDYQHWVAEYNSARTQLQEKLNEITLQITDLEQQIAALNKRITNCQNELAEQKIRLKEKTEEREAKFTYCEDENVAYAKRREERNDQREVVSDAIGLLQSHLRQFRQYVSERLKGIKKAD